jgi:hypothetical protein
VLVVCLLCVCCYVVCVAHVVICIDQYCTFRNVVVGELAVKYQGPGGALFEDIQVDTGIGESSTCGFR